MGPSASPPAAEQHSANVLGGHGGLHLVGSREKPSEGELSTAQRNSHDGARSLKAVLYETRHEAEALISSKTLRSARL